LSISLDNIWIWINAHSSQIDRVMTFSKMLVRYLLRTGSYGQQVKAKLQKASSSTKLKHYIVQWHVKILMGISNKILKDWWMLEVVCTI